MLDNQSVLLSNDSEQHRRVDVPGRGMRLFWLVYSAFVFTGPLFGPGTTQEWLIATGSLALFLPLYFGYWATLARTPRRAFGFVVAMAVFGFSLLPFSTGASVYVIYSAALVPFVQRTGWAVTYILALSLTLSLASFVYGYGLAAIAGILVVVGAGNMYYAESARRNAQLWRARQDVEDLAALAERERISRDLHDLLGHTLSVIALKSELAARLADTDPARAAAEIREVERVSRDALSQVRGAVEGYRARGFQGELRNAAAALEPAGVRLVSDVDATALPVRQESVMALALREAITNVVRHARATTCHVALCRQSDELVLTVQDDGAGGKPTEGHGLAGMRERVAALGGKVTLDGTQGMLLTVTLPAQEPS